MSADEYLEEYKRSVLYLVNDLGYIPIVNSNERDDIKELAIESAMNRFPDAHICYMERRSEIKSGGLGAKITSEQSRIGWYIWVGVRQFWKDIESISGLSIGCMGDGDLVTEKKDSIEMGDKMRSIQEFEMTRDNHRYLASLVGKKQNEINVRINDQKRARRSAAELIGKSMFSPAAAGSEVETWLSSARSLLFKSSDDENSDNGGDKIIDVYREFVMSYDYIPSDVALAHFGGYSKSSYGQSRRDLRDKEGFGFKRDGRKGWIVTQRPVVKDDVVDNSDTFTLEQVQQIVKKVIEQVMNE